MRTLYLVDVKKEKDLKQFADFCRDQADRFAKTLRSHTDTFDVKTKAEIEGCIMSVYAKIKEIAKQVEQDVGNARINFAYVDDGEMHYRFHPQAYVVLQTNPGTEEQVKEFLQKHPEYCVQDDRGNIVDFEATCETLRRHVAEQKETAK